MSDLENEAADIAIGIGVGCLNGALLGDWDQFDAALARYAVVMAGAAAARSGAATELDYYGGQS